MVEREPLPDFDLAPVSRLAPEKLVSRDQATEFEAFMLSLALFYNDWKNLAWVLGSVIKAKPTQDTDVSPAVGQIAGMNNHILRLLMGLLWELFRLLQQNKQAATGREMVNLAATISKESRDDWKDLLAVALGTDGKIGKVGFGRALQRIRDTVAFHYYTPKSLVLGYQEHFFAQPTTPKTEAALYSLGGNMEGTRFYFADAAADAAMKRQAREAGEDDLIKHFDELTKKLNFSIYSLVKAFITGRRLANG